MTVATNPTRGRADPDERFGALDERQQRRRQHRRSDSQRVLPAGHPRHLLRAVGQARLLRRRRRRLRLPMTTATAAPAMDAETIWRDLRGPLLAFIARRVSDPDTAEDILQDIMLRVHRHSSERTQPASITRVAVRGGPQCDHRPLPPGFGTPGTTGRNLPRPPRGRGAAGRGPRPAAPRARRLPDPTARTATGDLPRRATADRRRRAHPGRSRGPGRAVRLRNEDPVQRGRHQLKSLLEQCCEIAVDRRGGVADYQPHTGSCACHS